MPTKRTAQKSAALEAVKRLHEAGELKDDLKPLDRSDFDSEGEEDEMDCEEDKHTGTERSSDYYPNEVCLCIQIPIMIITYTVAIYGRVPSRLLY